MTPSQMQTMEQELRTAPTRFQAALVALATEHYPEASRHLRRLSQLETWLSKQGLDEVQLPEETEWLLEAAVPLAALVQCWLRAPGVPSAPVGAGARA